jgi:hypothetical protein
MGLFLQLETAPGLKLWVLMIGSISLLYQGDDTWLRSSYLQQMTICGISGWTEMRATVQEFLWIPLIHDLSGKASFEKLGIWDA